MEGVGDGDQSNSSVYLAKFLMHKDENLKFAPQHSYKRLSIVVHA